MKSAWNINYRIPFAKSLKVTYALPSNYSSDSIYLIIRGIENMPLNIGGVEIPLPEARLQLQKRSATIQPMDFISFVDIPASANLDGYVFQTTMQFESPNPNTLEGCVHWYDGSNRTWPGTLLASGTEVRDTCCSTLCPLKQVASDWVWIAKDHLQLDACATMIHIRRITMIPATTLIWMERHGALQWPEPQTCSTMEP